MHSALRPKPSTKLPTNLIPPVVSNVQAGPPLRKPTVNLVGDQSKNGLNNNLYSKPIVNNQKKPNGQILSSLLPTSTATTNSSPTTVPDRSAWTLGLISSKGKYLTSETFGHKINASGVCLKKKQKWTIIYNSQVDCFYLQSPLDNYLSTDKYGRLRCDVHDINPDCRFQLEYNQQGQWAFKSMSYGMYLGGDNDQLHCFSKTPEWWSPHLALHPQINLKHVLRKRYAKLNDDEIHIDEITPWGSEAILAVVYADGQYCIRSSNGLYFHKDGKLIPKQTRETLFAIELYKGYLTFKDCCQCYLTAIGPLGIMTTRNKIPGKDEQFLLEESKLQVSLVAPNGKLVSIKQGIDISANQSDKDDRNIFQLEYDEQLKLYHLRTYNNKFWKLEGNGLQATADQRSSETGFRIQSTSNGRVSFQAPNGKYIIPHATGHMRAIGDQTNSNETNFLIKFVNRPFCVLKCDFGYVAYRNKQSKILECNKSIFTLFTLEEEKFDKNAEDAVYFKGADGFYWEVLGDQTLSVSGSEPSKFSIELTSVHSKILIKAANGMYLRAEQNGAIQANAQNSRQATTWDF